MIKIKLSSHFRAQRFIISKIKLINSDYFLLSVLTV